MATIGDNRPRNPDHVRQIQKMFDPLVLRSEMDFYTQEIPERSVDDFLDNTENFREWARSKRKGTDLDPENRRPVQISDSPISDYDIEFTRLNRTDGLSSLSSLNIPTTSNASLTLINNSTPSLRSSIPRRSNTTPRRSGYLMPIDIVRQRQTEKIRKDQRQLKLQKHSLGPFQPTTFSTPVRSDRKKSSIFPGPTRRVPTETTPVVDSPNVEAQEMNNVQSEHGNAPTPIDISEGTLTNETNKGSESASATIIPETQENDSVIPETQENDTVIPETQGNDTVIPETQEDNVPATQDDVATDPVQAQVSKENTKQQAEPQNVLNHSTRSRILPRPPIRNRSQITTPSKYVPSSGAASKTPSRIPITASRTPVRSMASRSIVPKEANNEPHINDVTVSNAPNAPNAAGQTVVVVTSPKPQQSAQSAAVPPIFVPAPNMTINVNVNGSIPQSPKQIINTDDNNSGENVSKTKKGTQNSSVDSLMTNDSDSVENRASLSGPYVTPRGASDANNTSARRQLFAAPPSDESVRRSATFNKIDNLTRTITNGDSMASPAKAIQTRTRNTVQALQNGSTPKGTPQSQTFVKPKTSMQNATYDVSATNESDRVPCHLQYDPINSAEYLNQIENDQTMQRSNDNTADIPSEARLDTMNITDDADDGDNGVNQEHFADGSSDHSSNSSTMSRHTSKSGEKRRNANVNKTVTRPNPASPTWNPTVPLQRCDEPNSSTKSNGNSTNIFRGFSFGEIPPVTPPSFFQNTRNSARYPDNDLIDEESPMTSKRNFNKSVSGNSTTTAEQPKRSRGRPKKSSKENEALAALQESMANLNKKTHSDKREPRRLTSVHELRNDDSFESNERNETSMSKTNSSTAKDGAFKMPEVPTTVTRKSKGKASQTNKISNESEVPTTSAQKSRGKAQRTNRNSNESAEPHEDLVVTVQIDPVFDDDDEPNFYSMANPNESNVSPGSSPTTQRESSPQPEYQRTRKSTSTSTKPKKSDKANKKSKEPATSEEVDAEDRNTEEVDNTSNRRTTRTSATTSSKSKAPSKAKPKAKKSVESSDRIAEVESDDEQNTSRDSSASTESVEPRRSSRERITPYYLVDRRTLLSKISSSSGKKNIRKRNTDAPKTAPQLSTRDDESEPPSKKLRSLPSKTTRPTTSNQSVISSKSAKSSRTTQSGKSGARYSDNNAANIRKFLVGATEKRLNNSKWWKDIFDVTRKNTNTQEDATYMHTADGIIETSSTQQLEFIERAGVEYAFMPSKTRRYGFMRFAPGVSQARMKNSRELELHILRGAFTVHGDDGDLDVYGSCDVTIPCDAYYGLTNVGDCVGFIQFIYASDI